MTRLVNGRKIILPEGLVKMYEKKVFVVDDEAHIRELLEYNLKENGYHITCFEDAISLIAALKTDKPDAIILDLMLPKLSGIDACKIIRGNPETKLIPIIMLTAKNQEFDKVLGLELGADDYITKPFSIKELIARLRAVTRRFEASSISENNTDTIESSSSKDILTALDLTINLPKHEVLKNGKKLILTLKEFKLLKILVINAPNVLTRDALLNKIWGYDYFGDTRTVDVHIKNLRKVLDDKDETYIATVRGVGYRFNL